MTNTNIEITRSVLLSVTGWTAESIKGLTGFVVTSDGRALALDGGVLVEVGGDPGLADYYTDHAAVEQIEDASHLYHVYRTGEDERDQELVGHAVSLDAAVLLAHREHAHQIQLGEDGPVINVQPGNWIQHRQ